MATLKDKLVRMQNSRQIEYRVKNNYRIIAKKHDDGWHVTYYDSDWNELWKEDSLFATAEEVVDMIFAKEMTFISSCIEYLDEFIYEGVSVVVDPVFVRSTVIDNVDIKEGE